MIHDGRLAVKRILEEFWILRAGKVQPFCLSTHPPTFVWVDWCTDPQAEQRWHEVRRPDGVICQACATASLINRDARHRLLEFLDGRGGDLGADQVERLEPLQILERIKASVGDLGP